MAQVSQFSTPENFQKLTKALEQINIAIRESKLAVQAGIPQADETLKIAETAKSRIQQVLHTYFPEGTSPAESSS